MLTNPSFGKNCQRTKKYDPNIGFPNKRKPDIQWFIRNDGYVFYSSDVKKDSYIGSPCNVSFSFSEGDQFELEVIDFDKGIANKNDRISNIELPYAEGDLEVKDISKGEIQKLTYSLKVHE